MSTDYEPTTPAGDIQGYLHLARRGVELAERAHDEGNARDAARAVWAVDTCYFEASKLAEYVGPGDLAEVDRMMDTMDEYAVRAEELAASVPGAAEKIRAARDAGAPTPRSKP